MTRTRLLPILLAMLLAAVAVAAAAGQARAGNDTISPGGTRFRDGHPMNRAQRGLDGRIDDPNGGWKARGLYANYGTHLVWHTEGGKGTNGKIVKFQIRPDPLAR